MNSFFDLTEDEIKRGRCETNYFHMYVNADIDTKDISKLDAKTDNSANAKILLKNSALIN